ncbi:polyunsaturated fatty acid lipoxygenase ALOX15B-like [Falco naumanni]|uniref:polyunsaturated fatty acid lipoxygenase ALOX15B-like n=1 Tax=Falco naumanni TaxID=148594 RepID=UPI001ADE5F34|nr:polyunsaturated fatty acid lipoxygenase ALOX15B-like [Falco naumanni]
MIIYSCSAHHAATNSGQFELGAFMPNLPAAMREPPPSTKAPLTEPQFLAALPAMSTTAHILAVLWVLRNEPLDMRPLGCYPEQHFTEAPPPAADPGLPAPLGRHLPPHPPPQRGAGAAVPLPGPPRRGEQRRHLRGHRGGPPSPSPQPGAPPTWGNPADLGGLGVLDQTVAVEVTSARPLGTLLLLQLWKEPLVSLVPDRWFCACVTVTGPLGDNDDKGDTGDTPRATFPCYRWLESGLLELREGTARTPNGATWEPQLLQQRQEERKERQEAFHQVRVRLRGLRCGDSWRSFEDIQEALGGPGTPISGGSQVPDPPPAEYVLQHWQDDAFFGAQYLSGVNPVLLRRCARLPPNFPVTPPMVAPSLGPATTLQREMEGGRVFLADYALLEGVPTGRIAGEPQFLAAPLCLLWLSPRGQLLPIAIQLSQQPGPQAPIFLPGDGPWGWALAKLWVRGAHFALHEMVTHLLHSHFLGEVFALATHRLPTCHPLYQLLLPHCCYTFHINILARETLLNPGGIIDQATALGREGTLELVARGTAALTYTELCVPDDLENRGVTDIPNYYYRDDALEIWGAIKSLVQGIVALYYPEDSDVAEDYELQDWVGEIFTYAALSNEKTGFPSRLRTCAELVKFVTMIIFCCSARHAAVNSGQYDYAAWMPNTPGTLRRPPPRTKEEATAELLLGTLPSPSATGALLALLSVVSYEGGEQRPLGSRPQELLTGAAPQQLLGTFRRRLAAISHRIRRRNAGLALPYPYLDPACVQESVSI